MRLFEITVVSVLVALVSCSPSPVAAKPPASGPLVVRFDPAAAHAQGWVTPDASAEDVQKALLAFVRWRLSAAGIEHELESTPSGALVRTNARDSAARENARGILAALGPCEFYVLAEDGDKSAELAEERAHFEAWRREHPARPLLEYNVDPARPLPRIAWLPVRYGEERGPPRPVVLPQTAADAFGSHDFERAFPTTGNLDYPALGFELRKERVEAFASFTAHIVKRSLAIVLDSEVRSAPTVNSRLVGTSIIEGKFSEDEVQTLLTRMLAQSAPVVLVE
jgi:preprotein translocase subunit SecD